MKEGDLEFGISINPNFIPEGKEGISSKGWDTRINNGILKYNLRIREVLYFMNSSKIMLCGDYNSIKDFLEDVYGYVDYSSIYLWSAKTYDLINLYKVMPMDNLDIWRCL